MYNICLHETSNLTDDPFHFTYAILSVWHCLNCFGVLIYEYSKEEFLRLWNLLHQPCSSIFKGNMPLRVSLQKCAEFHATVDQDSACGQSTRFWHSNSNLHIEKNFPSCAYSISCPYLIISLVLALRLGYPQLYFCQSRDFTNGSNCYLLKPVNLSQCLPRNSFPFSYAHSTKHKNKNTMSTTEQQIIALSIENASKTRH